MSLDDRPEFIEEMTDEQLVEFLKAHVRLHAKVMARRLKRSPTIPFLELIADVTMAELLETLDEM